MAPNPDVIPALILAAGMSRRMGEPKLALPWGGTTVLGHVLDTYRHAGADPLFVVTGGNEDAVRKAAGKRAVWFLHNPEYRSGEMLSSIQVGLQSLLAGVWTACLLAPADLPALQAATIASLLAGYRDDGSLLVPSYRRRRGHPVLIGRRYWMEILALTPEQSLRVFFDKHADDLSYLNVDDPGIRADMDTPEDYQLLQQGDEHHGT